MWSSSTSRCRPNAAPTINPFDNFTHFGTEDVVRHPLVSKIVNAYDQVEKDNPSA